MQVNLRRNQSGPLTSDQADESIEFLSRTITVLGNTQLYSGGTYYQPSGNYQHTLPTGGGSLFSLAIGAGSATIVGEIDGVTNPVYSAGPERVFMRSGSEWHEVSTPAPTVVDPGSAVRAAYVTRTSGGDLSAALTWMLNGSPVTLTLPATASEDTRIGVVRGDALVSVVVASSGTILGYDQTTEAVTRVSEARLNLPHRLAEFVYLGGDWRVRL